MSFDDSIAEKIKTAYNEVLAGQILKALTRDLGGTASTNEFADAVIAKMQ